MLSIVEVRTKRELKAFVNFPIKLYRNCKEYVPTIRFDERNTLRRDKNPAMDFCESKYWLAYDGKKIVGRIAGIINHAANDLWQESAGRFGFIDFIEDIEVAKKLLETVEHWLISKGLTKIQGPLGFTDFDYEGMLIKGFEYMGTMTTVYNYAYYMTLLEKLGYVKDVDWLEYEIIIPRDVPDAVRVVAERAMKSNHLYVLEPKNKKELFKHVPKLFDLINTAFKELYEFTPLTDKQIKHYTKQYKMVIDPDFVKFVFNDRHQLVAYVLGFPSLARALQKNKGRLLPLGFIPILKALKKNKRLEIVQIAVDPKYQRKGVNAILFQELILSCNKRGIVCADLNPQLEDNKKVRSQWHRFKHRQHKIRTSFYKDLA
ncbi:GNAT family N-acetyltransferase [Vallitalea pronyensis]|uniref:GNAT family N-acetyltransferase n=1 Tax=Vallitalea pronyensis TaxID=1348613 RepID=A0A8J8MGV5_9FIRM|nr:GNAT family N-acetyltransferase [Vallitalea pronyensis]QUI21360.1 GNAT family N-acetyltransferase [Vallitalea pronyensis]